MKARPDCPAARAGPGFLPLAFRSRPVFRKAARDRGRRGLPSGCGRLYRGFYLPCVRLRFAGRAVRPDDEVRFLRASGRVHPRFADGVGRFCPGFL